MYFMQNDDKCEHFIKIVTNTIFCGIIVTDNGYYVYLYPKINKNQAERKKRCIL